MQSFRHWLTHNWLLKVFSLILATMFWIAVAKETSSEVGMDVPLEYRNIPPQLEITGDAIDIVQVRLRGSSTVIRGISPRDVSTTIDLGQMTAGEKVVALSPQNVQAPFGAEVIRVNPSSVRFNLERTASRDVIVVPAIVGDPSEGYEIANVAVSPSKVQIAGPESRVDVLESLPTLPIRIDGRQTPLAQTIEVDVADSQIRLVSAAPVEVRITIQKKVR